VFRDIHTHKTALQHHEWAIESLLYGQSPSLAQYSIGLHPWFLQGIDLADAQIWLADQARLPQVLAIGEAGLDKITETPWSIQLKAFEVCIEVSESVKKPLIIHCVRAFDEILALKKQVSPLQPWILHGFNKHLQTAEQLLNAGFMLSFGKHILLENNHASSALKITPHDAYFLETDDSPLPISTIFESSASIRDTSEAMIQQEVNANISRVFGVNIL
jgi:TatD DNase family protein